jgi:hypothetical protein
MNTSLVRECTISTSEHLQLHILWDEKTDSVRDGVHEGDVDLNSLGDQVLDLTQHRQVVLGLDILWIGSIEASDKTTKRCNADALADAKNG